MYDNVYATPTNAAASGGAIVMFLIVAALLAIFTVAMILALWKINTKAGRPGWAVLIPFYNTYVLLKIAGRPGWWLILFFIPLVSLVIGIIFAIDLAKAFGRSTTFGVVGIWLFTSIGYLILGFGKSTYHPEAVGIGGVPASQDQTPVAA